MPSTLRRTVLAVAPHIDDVELGVGATIHKLARNHDVHYLALSIPPNVDEQAFLAEFETSARILGIAPERIILQRYDPRDLAASRLELRSLLRHLADTLRPDLVFLPSSHDIHQSHETVFIEGRRAFTNTTVLGYELPWNNFVFRPDVYVRVTREELDAKLAAIGAFASQKQRRFFANNILEDLSRVRGRQIDCDLAECMEAVRIVLPPASLAATAEQCV